MEEFVPCNPYTFKIILLGSSGTGKTAITNRFAFNQFENWGTTVGIDYASKEIDIVDDKKVHLTIWDTAGQERFNSTTRSFIHGSHGIVLVYDITNRQSFERIPFWLELVATQHVGKSSLPPIVLVGNKTDLEDIRQVSSEEACEYAKDNNFTFIEASAKNSTHVDAIFTILAEQCVQHQDVLPYEIPPPAIDLTYAVAKPDDLCYCF